MPSSKSQHLERRSPTSFGLVVVVVLVIGMCAVGVTEAEPQPTIGLLGRAVQRWFREGIQAITGHGPFEETISSATGDIGSIASPTSSSSSDIREKVRLMIRERLKTRYQQQAESRAEGSSGSPLSRPGVTAELIGRFVSNVINALQKPDGIVNVMRQKVGFVSSNFRLSCYVCEMGVGLVRQYVYANRSLEEVSTSLANVCNLLSVTSERVCHGFLNEFLVSRAKVTIQCF